MKHLTINLIYTNTVPGINAEVVPNNDGSHTIVVNKNISFEQLREELLHELRHIKNNDFAIDLQANMIEKLVRQDKNNHDNIDLESIEVYCHFLDD